jgi:hypothetical protein
VGEANRLIMDRYFFDGVEEHSTFDAVNIFDMRETVSMSWALAYDMPHKLFRRGRKQTRQEAHELICAYKEALASLDEFDDDLARYAVPLLMSRVPVETVRVWAETDIKTAFVMFFHDEPIERIDVVVENGIDQSLFGNLVGG